ncbi:hypothetical protein ABZ490_25830 [Streptomyces sp. NPDC005811]|uniref:hypothetical protein n=1 Tax=Streptomyces sp. NPDC005811 TaxID=3154565 RepID=UPI003410F475
MRAQRFGPSADRAVVRLVGAGVMALVAVGSATGQGWARPASEPGARSAADYTPVTGTVRGRVGDTVVVRLGVANLGPGAPDGGAPGTFAVVPPPGTTITSIPWEGDDDDRRYACRPPQDEDNPFFLCDLSEWRAPAPGTSVTLGFHIRIDRRIPGAEGSVTVYGPHDPVPGNDSAAFRVRAAPAPARRWRQALLTAGAAACAVWAGGRFVRRRRQRMS